MRDGVHPTLFEHVAGGRVDPHMIWSSPGLVDLSYPVSTSGGQHSAKGEHHVL